MSLPTSRSRARLRAAALAAVGLAIVGVAVVAAGLPLRPRAATCAADASAAACATASPIDSPTQPVTLQPSPVPAGATAAASSPSGSPYTFRDEFDGTSLGPAWGRHWGNVGVATASRGQTSVRAGNLVIQATRSGNAWTSDSVDTFGSFTQLYGTFEARIRIPEGRGLWPAFWLAQDWAVSGVEIDGMEVCANPPSGTGGMDARVLQQTVHGPDGRAAGERKVVTPGLATGWHTYAIDWRHDYVAFSFDGVETYRYVGAAVPHVAMPIILSLGVGSWCGPTDATTPSPATMEVDWVRASP